MTDYIRVFIDTEFSDFVEMELISIGLVTARGDEFYAEAANFNRSLCSSFVVEHVLPYLSDSGDRKMPRDRLQLELARWLRRVKGNCRTVVVSYDFFGDYALLIEALGKAPDWLRADNVLDRTSEPARVEFWERSGLLQHHALNDARALRHAFQARNEPRRLASVLQKFAAFDTKTMDTGRNEQEQDRPDLESPT